MADIGASERDQLLRQRIVGMTPDDFEQLVFELVRRDEPTAERIKAPDGGADVLRSETEQRPAKVWQAKRYAGDINWGECEESLVRAIGRWSPEEIVFVFARDLSETTEASFTTRLAEHHAAIEVSAAITRWGISELVLRLNEHDDLRVRFFGRDLEPLWKALNRTIGAGGALESAEDLIERAKTLSEWAAEKDKRFRQSLITSELEAPEPKWDELPYMTLQIADSSTRVNIATWPREGAEVRPSLFGFLDNEAGARARGAAIQQLARGEPAEITEGAHVQMDAPEIMRALAAKQEIQGGAMTLNPGDPIRLGIEIPLLDGGVLSRSIDMYNAPPPPGAVGALVGYSGTVLVQMIIRLLEEPRIRLELQLSGQFAGDIRDNAEAAELLLAFYEQHEGTLKSAMLFPSGELTAPLHEGSDEEKVQELQILNSLFGSIVFIEDRLGITLTPPPKVSPEDVDALHTIRRVLETGEGTATFEGMTGMVANPQEIAWLAERASGSIHRRPVAYEIFGQAVTLGIGAYELPRLKVIEVVPYGQTPEVPARVVLGADGNPEMRFRLNS